MSKLKTKIALISLGCDKNLVDSEQMLFLLGKEGYELTDDDTDCDIAVVNTCCFINDAKEESIDYLIDFEDRKKAGELKGVIVTGCLAQRYREEIKKEFPAIDAIVGTNAFDKIVEAVKDIEKGIRKDYDRGLDEQPVFVKGRVLSTGGHYAYLKIAEGCDKRCTYCIIPHIRGSYRSFPMEELVAQARDLVEGGVRELILVAQETTLYGKDIYGEKKLPDLLKELCRIEDLRWIRLLYCYPEEITDELIDVIASEDKICNYLDIPIQHASDCILKKMGRYTDNEHLIALIKKLKDRIPDICIRTTLITGFPGESEEDFEIMKSFIKEERFDRLGVFKYSPEEGTVAATLEDQISDEIKEDRFNELYEIQHDIAIERNEAMVGKEVSVMVEGYLPEDNVYVGRTYRDAPDVDGMIFFEYDGELMSGEFMKVAVTNSEEYDLIGEVINEPSE